MIQKLSPSWPSRLNFCFASTVCLMGFLGCYPNTPEEVLRKYWTSENQKAWEYLTAVSAASSTFEQFAKDRAPGKDGDIKEVNPLQTGNPDVVRLRVKVVDEKGNNTMRYVTLNREEGRWKVASTRALIQMADEARSADRVDESISLNKQALLIDPYNVLNKYRLSSIYLFEKKSTEDAEKMARSAIEDAPDLSLGHFALGNVLNRKSNFAEAEKSFDMAIQYGLPATEIGWPLVLAQLENRNTDKAKKVIGEIMKQAGPVSNENLGIFLEIVNQYDLQELLDTHKDLFEANPERLSPEVKCKLRTVRFKQALLDVKKASGNAQVKKFMALEADALALKKECPESAGVGDNLLKGVRKIRQAQAQIETNKRNFNTLMSSEEGRTAFALNTALGEFGFQRLLRCLETVNDGVKAAAGLEGMRYSGDNLNAMKYYNEATWYDKFKMLKKLINSKAGSDSKAWYIRKKLWEDWCYFDDELARGVAESKTGN